MSKKNTSIKLLTFNGTYLPGYKAGGPIRSIANLVENLNDEIDFNVVCQDRDFYDTEPYPNINVDEWNKVNEAKVFYHSSNNIRFSTIKKIINSSDYDITYLNGFFSEYTIKYLLLRKVKLIKNKPVIIVPRGDLANGALSLKSLKKKSFIKLNKFFGLYKNLTWQATSHEENVDIKNIMGHDADVHTIGNFAPKVQESSIEIRSPKVENELNIIFISRITKVKNIKFAIEQITKLEGKVKFDIYGPVSDDEYWKECLDLIEKSPSNIVVKYNGSIENKKVSKVLRSADIMFLPTLGENFGHVIVESLIAGTPILISDQTPWRNLVKHGVGWDIPLDCPEKYVQKLQYVMGLNEEKYVQSFSSINYFVQEYIVKDDKSKMFINMIKKKCNVKY